MAELTRRNFVAGAIATGMVASTGTLASAAMADEADGSEKVVDVVGGYQMGVGADPIAPVEAPAEWDAEYDVVVVGAGGGGLNAACCALTQGLSCTLIDKNVFVGGSTLEATGFVGCIGSRIMPWDSGDPVLEGFYGTSVDDLIAKWEPCDHDLMKRLFSEAGPVVDWMTDELGCAWVRDQNEDGSFAVCGTADGVTEGNIEGTHVEIGNKMIRKITDQQGAFFEENGGDLRLSTNVERLVVEDGRVVGVLAKSGEEELYLKGIKGVILATGDICNNPDMLEKYVPTAFSCCDQCITMPWNTGDGVRMAMGAGADTCGFDTFDTYDGGLDYYRNGYGSFYRFMFGGDSALVSAFWLAVNKEGKRFMKTGTGGFYGNFEVFHLMQQTGKRYYSIFDANYAEDIMKQPLVGNHWPLTPDMKRIEVIQGYCSPDWTTEVETAMELGLIQQADTLEELAEKLGIDAEGLAVTVEEWNGLCEAGEDPEYGQNELYPVAQPPFYGAKVGGRIWKTSFGIRVNPDMEALDTDGKIIPGLYVASNAIGGDKGAFNHTAMSPLAGIGLSFTTGYIAGKAIAAQA